MVLELIGNLTDLSHIHLVYVLVTLKEEDLLRVPFTICNASYG